MKWYKVEQVSSFLHPSCTTIKNYCKITWAICCTGWSEVLWSWLMMRLAKPIIDFCLFKIIQDCKNRLQSLSFSFSIDGRRKWQLVTQTQHVKQCKEPKRSSWINLQSVMMHAFSFWLIIFDSKIHSLSSSFSTFLRAFLFVILPWIYSVIISGDQPLISWDRNRSCLCLREIIIFFINLGSVNNCMLWTLVYWRCVKHKKNSPYII